MTLDRHAAERRRFARLLGVDGELGSGLPIGDASRGPEDRTERDRARDDRARASPDAETETEADSVSVPSSGAEEST